MICPKCGKENPNGSAICCQCEKDSSQVPKETENEVKLNQEGKKTLNIPVVGAAALILIALIIIFCNMLRTGAKKDDAFVCLSDGKYNLITDIKKDEVIEIASSKSDIDIDNEDIVAFSPDGKYFYYLTRYDGFTGTLCRAEYGKLKKDSLKNDSYIETIATNVLPEFEVLDNGMLLYQDEEDRLYVYDGKESTRIADDVVSGYWYNQGNRLVFSTREDWTLYGINLKHLDTKNKIDSHIERIVDASDLDNIIYTKFKQTHNLETLYAAGFDKKPVEIKDAVEIIKATGEKTYFIEINDKKIRLYDYVEDIQIREALKQGGDECQIGTLYCYEHGKLKTVNEDIIFIRSYNGAIGYITTDCITENVDINDIDYDDQLWLSFASQFIDFLSQSYEYYTIVLENGNACKMSKKAAEALEDIRGDFNLYFTEKEAFLHLNDGTLFVAAIKNGVVGNFSTLAEESEVVGICNSKLIYLCEPYERENKTYYDMYSYSREKKTKLASEVTSSVYVYEDETIIYSTGYRRNQGYEYSIVNNSGEKTFLGEDIYRALRVDKNKWLYTSDGDLYLYDGKEKLKLQGEVSLFWSKNTLKPLLKYFIY